MTRLKASVIIPTKNPGAIFNRVLDAVCKQETDFPYDVLVIDSGSTDGTIQYVQNHADARVRLHQILPTEFGHGRTRNLGVSLTEGEYAVLITHDACPATEHWLSSMVELADQDERIAGVFGRHIAYPTASPFTIHELEQHFLGFDRDPIVSLDDKQRYADDPGYRQFLHFFSDNNALVRRTVWQSIPYPDVDFAEDQIWAQKIIEAGWKKGYSKEGSVFHSHDYSLIERLQRSFDESYAFLRLFNYKLCPSLRIMLRTWLALNARDWRFAREKGLTKTSPMIVPRAFLDNLMRLLGHYLGTIGDTLPPRLRTKLSHDRRLLDGLRKGSEYKEAA
ncbi:family 2 glycosyl transferase [Pollutimonas subterranea]|uniref:Family 2 glycosyl transferase n=1 Tax=Pollutimonas subterranea TaxID=2045210 RepID=A0A2N4TZ65_9BURK|nr:glycosyltransferase family 2 protein [Pollutimonas subterranea]PLC48055.1 family 2 glycosyl transferase [Pollutimonas subterranea]